ncbi:MAG: HD domain-containing phosphohydrolase [Spirochaetota bacterium]|nr:HD domain-containing phosphohydrolase [Spirochaetota bacterium]
MSNKVLFVDDDVNILSSFKRQLRSKFDVETAESGRKGLEILKNNGPYSIVVSDYRMPEMNGVEFLTEVREIAPDSVRFMLTGQADMQAVVDIVNKGSIFRFLIKPCPIELVEKNINDGIEQYNLIKAEKELLENTLSGSVKMLAEILATVKPLAFSRAARIRLLSIQLSKVCKMKNQWEMEIAAILSQIGCVTISEEILTKVYSGITPSQKEIEIFESHVTTGMELISKIPRLEKVAKIVYYQEKNYDGSGFPEDDVKGNSIPLGARILKILYAYDTFLLSGASEDQALQRIKLLKNRFDPAIVHVFDKVMSLKKKYKKVEIELDKLNTSMIIAEDIEIMSGVTVASKGQEVTSSTIVLLKNFEKSEGLKKPIMVLSPQG